MSIMQTILSNWSLHIEIPVSTEESLNSPHCMMEHGWKGREGGMERGKVMVWDRKKEVIWICLSRQDPKSSVSEWENWARPLRSKVVGRGEVGSTRVWQAASKKAGVSKRRGGEKETKANSLHFSFLVSVDTTSEWGTCWSPSWGKVVQKVNLLISVCLTTTKKPLSLSPGVFCSERDKQPKLTDQSPYEASAVYIFI